MRFRDRGAIASCAAFSGKRRHWATNTTWRAPYRVLRSTVLIKSFRSRDTARVFDDLLSKPFQSVHSIARRKLLSLNAATSLNDLRAVPGNRFEALKQDRAGQHAIRVNDQYRICFVWREGDAYEVEITKHYS
jgi:proteic killer suppression protein